MPSFAERYRRRAEDREKVDQASPGLEEGWASQRLIAINNSPLLEYTTPRNEIMQIKRKF